MRMITPVPIAARTRSGARTAFLLAVSSTPLLMACRNEALPSAPDAALDGGEGEPGDAAYPGDSAQDSPTDTSADAETTTDACAPGPVDEALHQRILAAWATARPLLESSLAPGLVRDSSAPLYDVQLWTANLLMYAEGIRDARLVESLATLYERAYEGLRHTRRALYYYAKGPDGVERRQQVFDLPEPVHMWAGPPTDEYDIGPEIVLTSAQFLYAVARVVRIVTEMNRPSAALRDFVRRSVPILAQDHYRRWLRREDGGPGSFQVRGWGCNPGTFDHRERVANLLARRYGTRALGGDSDLSFCNAVTDTDLWIIAGIAELVAAHHRDPALVPLDETLARMFASHVQAGLALIESRHQVTVLTTPSGRVVTGAVFDRGAFDDHSDYAYAGFTETGPGCEMCVPSCPDQCPQFPGWKGDSSGGPRVASVPAVGTGWDISHARRLVPVYDTLRRHRALFDSDFPTSEDEAQFARQLAYAVWNGDADEPRFATYFDGTNGWYRVNYAGRDAFGYAPGTQTVLADTCGYGFWRSLEPTLGTALDAVAQKYDTERDPALPADARRLLLVLPERAAYEGRDGPCPWSR